MHIFCLPSWYRSPEDPIRGVFFIEQAKAFTKHYQDSRISLYSYGDFDLIHWKRVRSNVHTLGRWFKAKSYFTPVSDNFTEFFEPVLTQDRRYNSKAINKLIQHSISAYRRYEKEYGKIDLIHAHVCWKAGYIAYCMSKELGVPYVITEHMAPFLFSELEINGKAIPEIKHAFSKASRIIAVSKSLVADIRKYYLLATDIIPNFINEDLFTVKNHITDRFTFLCIAKIVKVKGIDILLKAFKRVVQKHPSLQLRIVGAGSEQERLKQYTKDNNLENNVVWLDCLLQDEVRNEIQKSDAFVLPSNYESFGVVYIEALACGKPIIATKCGGPEDIVTNDYIGDIIPKGDIDALVESMNHMYESYNEYDSNKIRKFFLMNYSSMVVCQRYYELFRDVISCRDNRDDVELGLFD